ncbi:MAG: DUF1565 domain-containing protein [bacterium]|nr:DUF1565 domain-containing protein [bacterium]
MKLLLATIALSCAPPLYANDWYVDASGGSSSNSGTAPTDAWPTITYALQQIGAGTGTDTIHVLPGVYDAVLGESFPLRVVDGLRIKGQQGPDVTIVRGSTGFLLDAAIGSIAAEIEGLTIADASDGIECTKPAPPNGCIRLTVRDCVFVDCHTSIAYGSHVWSFFCNSIDVEDVRFVRGSWGVRVEHQGFDDINVGVVRCTFEDTTIGVYMNAGEECIDSLTVGGCRFEGASSAITTTTSSSGQMFTGVNNTIVANCNRGMYAEYGALVSRSTFAYITNEAVDGGGTIRDSILSFNGTDLAGSYTVTNTNLGGGGPDVGHNGNISVDPLFRAPDRGDYRLGWGTGCVDAINPASGNDHTGFPRGNDGDFDLVGAGDMGALELRTLDAPETVSIGGKLPIEFHGEVGNFTVLWLARSTQLPVADSTPFGERWLPLVLLELVTTEKVLTSDPVRHTVYVPDNPALIGMPFSFQALSRSSNAPAGSAWGDAVTVTVVQ